MEPLHTPRGVARGPLCYRRDEACGERLIKALGHSEVFVCITDSAGRRTHTSDTFASWLADDPDLLQHDGHFVRDGRTWVTTTERRPSGKPCTS